MESCLLILGLKKFFSGFFSWWHCTTKIIVIFLSIYFRTWKSSLIYLRSLYTWGLIKVFFIIISITYLYMNIMYVMRIPNIFIIQKFFCLPDLVIMNFIRSLWDQKTMGFEQSYPICRIHIFNITDNQTHKLLCLDLLIFGKLINVWALNSNELQKELKFIMCLIKYYILRCKF